MLPVQLRVLHSSCCTLSQASALLERFLSSDACSDSFVRDYVANVGQALHDSISKRGGLEHCHLPAGAYVRPTDPCFPRRKLTTDGKNCLPCSLGPTGKKQGLPAAQDVGQDASDMNAGSASPDAKGASLRSAQRRETLSLSSPSETEASAYAHYNRKNRAKENHETETFNHGVHDRKVCDKRKRKAEPQTQTENAVTEYTAPASLDMKRRRKKKKQRMLS